VLLVLAGLVFVACGTDSAVGPGSARTEIAAPTAAASATPGPAIRDPAGVQDLLDRVAEAMVAGDTATVAALVADPADDFGRRWQERATNMASLPFSSYGLELDADLHDLASDSVRARFSEPVQVVAVLERHALEGFDETGPAEESLFLTLVERDGAWRVAGDQDAEAFGLISVDHLWDQGPVVLSAGDRVRALHHPGTPNIAAIVQQAEQAVDDIVRRWPLDWPGRVPVIIPSSQDELGELLHVTFDLSNFVAFATATPSGELGSYQLTGVRIVVNPDKFVDRSAESRRLTLLHELLHVATRSVAGPYVPNWLEEGLAQVLGEQRSTTGTRLLDAVVDDELALPRDGQFTSGDRDRIFLSYQSAWSFVDWLVDRHGADDVADFYLAIGDGDQEPGTEPWHIDEAARRVFDATLEELIGQWAASR